ncbi:ABC transporter ATP-binding protein [Nitriliruptor alkaliphilus]|uniref:ABC transporter ATP-binding protein n=1 Tax=Nitriliruptor alkaliphilus TaxID=427918 RepID=UPI0006966BAF|nr:ABC transporter ATP-binding protein [Nitriliruptor alkaliphilus]
MDTSTALRTRGITKRFGRRTVLTDASFQVERGEAVAIIGENGAGKTTLLRVCAGLLGVDAGTVHREGRVGYCPQEPGIVDLLTAEQHLLLFGAAAGLSRREARVSGLELLGSFGLDETRTVAKDLSGGNRQKLNLALALLGDPAVLLLDEPYQGFDLGSYVDFWAHAERWRKEGRAVVVVTHLLTELHRVDRVVEVRGGLVHEREVDAA